MLIVNISKVLKDGRSVPINTKGSETVAELKTEDEIRKFLKGCSIRPTSRADRYVAPAGSNDCYFLTLESFKKIRPYLIKFNYID